MPSRIFSKVARFASVGVLATILYLLISIVLIKMSIAPMKASFFAYLICIFFSYAGQAGWTFKKSLGDKRQFAKFLLVSIFGLFISVIAVFLAGFFGFHPFVGLVVTAIVVPLASFLSFNFWVFSQK